MKTKNQPLFVLSCTTFGPKFTFNAENQHEADIKARQYCHYHSMSDAFVAEAFDAGKDYGFNLAVENDYMDFN